MRTSQSFRARDVYDANPERHNNMERSAATWSASPCSKERALLSIDDSLDELALLAETAGIKVVGRTWQKLRQVNPKTC